MAAVAFFYAGSMQIQWQLLIVIIFLFFGTLAFFSVLFDKSSELPTALVTDTLQDIDNDSYQNYSSSIA